MKKRAWWEDEWWNEHQKQDVIDWLKKETILEEIRKKEEIIIKAFIKDVLKIKEEIKKLEKQIEEKEKECSKCLAKIHTGDSGLMEILGERNGRDLTQIHTEKELNLLLMENGLEEMEKNGADSGQKKKSITVTE